MLLSFYGSTPSYKPVLDTHGWGDLQPELNAMSKQGKWATMAGLINDEVMTTIAACGTPAEVAATHRRPGRRRRPIRVCFYQAAPASHSKHCPRSSPN